MIKDGQDTANPPYSILFSMETNKKIKHTLKDIIETVNNNIKETDDELGSSKIEILQVLIK